MPHWSPERFAAVLGRVRDAMGVNIAELGRLAGVSRSQASRWGHGAHQPAYANVRQLAIAVCREFPELAHELMLAAGYPPVTGEDLAAEAGPLDDLKVDGGWLHSWEEEVAAEESIPAGIRRQLIVSWRNDWSRARSGRRRQNGAHATGAA